ncbi:MAG: TolC family protein [Phycisphaerales bacterium JB063]
MTALVALWTVALSGCVSYEPAPIDLSTMEHDWAQRLQDMPGMSDDTPGPGLGDGLTLDEAIAVALYGNPSLRHARLEAGVELASAQHAGLWDDPELSFDLMRNVDAGTDPWIYGASLGFTIPLSGRLDVERDQAWASYDTAWYAVAIAEWELTRELTRDWIAWSATREQARAQARYLDDLDALIDTANALVEQGELAPAEARLLQIEQMQRSIAMLQLENEAARQHRALVALMGLKPGVPYELTPTLEAPAPQGETQAPTPQTHPRVLSALAQYEQAELALRRETVKQRPDLTLGPAFENEEGQSRIGFGLGLPLPMWNANRQGIAVASAARAAAHAQVELAYQSASAELHEAAMRQRAADAMRQAVRDDLLPLTARQIDEARRLVELGEIEVLLLSQAVIAAADTELMLIELRAQAAAASMDYQLLTHPRWATQPQARPEND